MNKKKWAKNDRLSFGKHKGKVLSEVPDSYLIWMMFNISKKDYLVEACKKELLTRGFKIEWLYQKSLESLLEPTPDYVLEKIKKSKRNKLKDFLDSTVGAKHGIFDHEDEDEWY